MPGPGRTLRSQSLTPWQHKAWAPTAHGPGAGGAGAAGCPGSLRCPRQVACGFCLPGCALRAGSWLPLTVPARHLLALPHGWAWPGHGPGEHGVSRDPGPPLSTLPGGSTQGSVRREDDSWAAGKFNLPELLARELPGTGVGGESSNSLGSGGGGAEGSEIHFSSCQPGGGWRQGPPPPFLAGAPVLRRAG